MWEIGFEGKYIFRKRFIFTANANVGFNRWAVVPKWTLQYDDNGQPIYDISGVQEGKLEYFLENDIRRNPDGTKSSVKPVLNFGIGFEYLINKQFTVFANVNNIGHQYATNYYGFNNFGINILAGVTYSFGNEAFKPIKKQKN